MAPKTKKPSERRYIHAYRPNGVHRAWYVRIPIGKEYDGDRVMPLYNSNLFHHAEFDGDQERSLQAAREWRDGQISPGKTGDIDSRLFSVVAGSARQGKASGAQRSPGSDDLPSCIFATSRKIRTKSGRVWTQYSLRVETWYNDQHFTKNYSYGNSRTRSEALDLAIAKLAEFNEEIAQLKRADRNEFYSRGKS